MSVREVRGQDRQTKKRHKIHVPQHFSAGSQESIGRFDRDKRRKGEKERLSMLISERTHSESAKDKSTFEKRSKGHKRQRSWGGNKLLEVEGAGL